MQEQEREIQIQCSYSVTMMLSKKLSLKMSTIFLHQESFQNFTTRKN